MAPVTSLLASTLLFASLAVAVPLHSEVGLAANKRSTATIGKMGSDGKKYRRLRAARVVAGSRRKRQVFAEEEPDEPTVDQQLAGLTDDQLALLANIVQGELEKYDPSLAPETYKIVELPDEIFANQFSDGDDGVYEDIEIVPRERLMFAEDDEPIMVVPEEELEQIAQEDEGTDQQPQVVFVPEEIENVEAGEAEVQDALDELELRERIAELAEILNERATRREI